MKPELIEAVWQHGRVMPEADPQHWRQDECGAWMRREHFGHEDSEFGWKAESVVAGAPPSVQTLRPFHCRNGYDLENGSLRRRVSADRSNVPAEKYASPPRNRSA